MAVKGVFEGLLMVIIAVNFVSLSSSFNANRLSDLKEQQNGGNDLPGHSLSTNVTSSPKYKAFVGRLKKLGKINGQTVFEKMIPTENDIFNPLFDEHPRIKRSTSGVLRSKNIRAGEIRSLDIKSRNVLADKIVGDKIIAETVIVSNNIRNRETKPGQGDKTDTNVVEKQPKKEKPSTPKKAKDEHPDKKGHKIEQPEKDKHVKTKKTKGGHSEIPDKKGQKVEKPEKDKHVKTKKTKGGHSDRKGLQTEKQIKKASSDKQTKEKHLVTVDKGKGKKPKTPTKSEHVEVGKPLLSPFIHEPNGPLSGLEFVRPQKASYKKSKSSLYGSESFRDIPKGNFYDQSLGNRERKFQNDYQIVLDSLPQLAEGNEHGVKKIKIENGVTKERIQPKADKTTTSSDSGLGLLRAKEIKSGSIEALNTEAKMIAADSIRSNFIDAKFIRMRKEKRKPNSNSKPKLSEFRHVNHVFSPKKTSNIKPLWSVSDKSKTQKFRPHSERKILRQEEIVKNVDNIHGIRDHNPFDSGHVLFREK